MKKTILTLAASLALSMAHAQPDTSTISGLLDYINQPLDKAQIPTGYLEEYGPPVLGMEPFGED